MATTTEHSNAPRALESDKIAPAPHVVDAETKTDTKTSSASEKEPVSPLHKQTSNSTEHELDAKNITSPNYNDPERQSSHVGSIGEGRQTYKPYQYQFYTTHRYKKHVLSLITFIVFTAWLAYGLVHHRDIDAEGHMGWLKPSLLYIAIMIRLITLYVPAGLALVPLRFVWRQTVSRIYNAIPAKLHQPLAAIGAFAVFCIGSFVPEETGDNTRANRAISIFGLLVMMALLTATSRDWRKIPWHTVIGGMLTQFVIAVFVLRTQVGYDIFAFISEMARSLLGFADKGLIFLTTDSVANLHWFLTGVIPPIVFFVALVQMLYYLGFLQWFIGKFAVFFFWTLRVSGAEAVVAAATPFIGQGESAMLIKPFMNHATLAELHQIMACGFATIAGSVLVVYIGLGLNAQALVSSCIMSIPASLAVSKMRYPETEETLTSGKVVIPKDADSEDTVSALHAFTNGAWLGIKIAGTIIACLLCIVAFVALIDGLLGWWGRYFSITNPELSLGFILGYILYPVAWLLGVPKQDLHAVGELIGLKIIANEYVAFFKLVNEEPFKLMLPRSKLIATYACCGFGNIGSLGIQIGVLAQIAPKRSGDVLKVALSALFSGVLATLTSASIAGMLFV
ncbi:Na+ dependent nucleoside transporter C-terminus-domain-containing protein [Podospora didyma]|uniref:Na+ dependent nucleoside transporter C-terminus-domain-containing protein n=1 Tax=Podospora didyma TaxID=330526 RepID=A0AAE0TZX7_9PEZI|nr:Na+ dependent nucleoside transporter C-terminus-domain-containing protein [Podospora didyma]